jgi:hypothetical protein
LSDYREQMNQAYWDGFVRFMTVEHPEYSFGSVSKQGWLVVPPLLRPGVQIAVGMNRKDGESIRVDVTLTNTPPEWYDQLLRDAQEIKREVGITDAHWEWPPRPGKAESHIILRKPVRFDGARRPQYEWLGEAAHRFHLVFGPRVAALT